MNIEFVCMVCTILLGVINSSNAKEVESRISGGMPAFWDERFAVRIICAVNDRAPQGYLSTGVAVTGQHVVTVAQAIAGFSIWRIGYGDVFVERQYEVISRNGVPHPEFNATLLHNNVRVIRVPYLLDNWIYGHIFFSSTLYPQVVSGYGIINDTLVLANQLQVAGIGLLPLSLCSDFFGDEFVRNDNRCVTNSNDLTRIRNGDQGGPAFFGSEVTGIVSFWGLSPGSPIVLVDLREHRSFLEGQFAI